MNILEQLKKMTTVVADTGELSAMKQYLPEDATTNPSLILKVAQLPEGEALLARAAQWAQQQSDDPEQQHQDACDILGVFVGCEILKLIPGRVSTEVDAKLSYDTEKSIAKAERLIALYEAQGVSRDRVLIKLASTWQGIKAAEKLEAEGIKCNLTLLFSFAQAQACAEAGAYLISPFVGRILDWYKKSTGEEYQAETDPGVLSVRRIYQYYKAHGYSTVVMGASFRNVGEIIALAGCDRLTIGPNLLDELAQMEGQLEQVLVAGGASQAKPTPMTESEFYWEHNSDPMAVEKLAEGIRNFAKDQSTMEQLISKALSASISA